MTRVVWTRPARDDVRAIRAYIARDSPRYARAVAERLIGGLRSGGYAVRLSDVLAGELAR